MQILITGSSGQVGTNLSLALLEKGHTILGLDRRPNTWTDQIPLMCRDIATEGMPTLAEIKARMYEISETTPELWAVN